MGDGVGAGQARVQGGGAGGQQQQQQQGAGLHGDGVTAVRCGWRHIYTGGDMIDCSHY